MPSWSPPGTCQPADRQNHHDAEESTVRRQEVWKFGGTSVDDAEKRRPIGMKVTRTRDKDVVVVGLHPAATNASSS
jgi:hypothetical protein